MVDKGALEKKGEYTWDVPKSFRDDMNVPGRIFTSEELIGSVLGDRSVGQIVNVSTLPGIQEASLAMPDVHEGYGFPVGGVAAFDKDEGVISPGGIGFDINCGVRVLRTGVSYKEVQDAIPKLTRNFYDSVPSGVGQGGRLDLNISKLEKVLENGVDQMIEWGYATEEDRKHCESQGRLKDANPDLVSDKAKKRGQDQVGTLGSGNHFLEIQGIDRVIDKKAAEALSIKRGEILIMIHCGSRGFGHQVATDYIKRMLDAEDKYGIDLVDDQLACAPFDSPEGKDYWAAMCAGANFAWANRQFITHLVREAWDETFEGRSIPDGDNIELIYDVAHNIAKVESHKVGDEEKQVVVHRKGATRSFPAGHPETPELYNEVGQPVLIPGSMGTASYVLVGAEGSMKRSFGSSCHGAGRVMSRTQAKNEVWGEDLKEELESRGISIEAGSMAGLAEEAPLAYKNVRDVVGVVEGLNLARRVARMRPLGVVKG